MTAKPQAKTLTQLDELRERDAQPLDMRLLVRLWQFTRPYAFKRNAVLVLVVIRAIQLPLLAMLTGWIMSVPVAEGDTRMLLWSVVGFFLLALATQVSFHYRTKLAMQLGESVVHDLRRDLFAQIQRMPMVFFNQTKLGRIISRLTSDVEHVRAGVQEVLFVTIVNGGQMLVAAAIMAWLDFYLFVIVVLLAPVLYLINRAFEGTFAKAHRATQESFSRVTATIAESVDGIRVTQGFVRQDINAEAFDELVTDHGEYNMSVQRANALFVPLLEINAQFFIAALLLVGGYRVLNPEIAAPMSELIMFFFMANVFFHPVTIIGTQYTHALTAMAGAERVFRLLDMEPAWKDRDDAVPLPPIHGRVEFENVGFEYVPGRPVLYDINFVAEPGQVVALVGATGSGKSSIINLISRFYLPTQGRLTIDGYDICEVTGPSHAEQMGIVLQVNFLFTGTVMENIKVGKPDATDDEVFEAARKLDCLDLLDALPQGLYTQVGEKGGSLSLGQRQLVCFTRAMLANPRIMILDEATSSVDTMTEARITKALQILLKERTCFVVAHRLSTIRHADVVLVLQDGRIIERGTHIELLGEGGVYANLYRQFIRASEA